MPLKMIDFNFALEFEIVFLTLGKSVTSLYLGTSYTHFLLCHK